MAVQKYMGKVFQAPLDKSLPKRLKGSSETKIPKQISNAIRMDIQQSTSFSVYQKVQLQNLLNITSENKVISVIRGITSTKKKARGIKTRPSGIINSVADLSTLNEIMPNYVKAKSYVLGGPSFYAKVTKINSEWESVTQNYGRRIPVQKVQINAVRRLAKVSIKMKTVLDENFRFGSKESDLSHELYLLARLINKDFNDNKTMLDEMDNAIISKYSSMSLDVQKETRARLSAEYYALSR